MEEHRARHREKYLERERIIKIRENYIQVLKEHTNLNQIKNTTAEILEFVAKGDSEFGLKVVDAINNRHYHIIEWLLEHNCPVDDLVFTIYKQTNDIIVKTIWNKFFK